MKKTFLFFSFMGCFFLLFSQNQICVDGNLGSDSGSGTPSNPYKTVQKAVTSAANGDIIKVAKGIYSESVLISNKSVQLLGGFAGNGDFSAANPAENISVIQGIDVNTNFIVKISRDAEISGETVIRGFSIRGGLQGITLDGDGRGLCKNITIEENIIENNGSPDENSRGGGIGMEGDNIKILNNIIRNNKAGRGAAICATSGGAYYPKNFLIDGNIIKDNIGYSDHGGGFHINGTGTISNNLFEGNRIGEAMGYGYGGAIVTVNYNIALEIRMTKNIYRNNYAALDGGAVFVDDVSKVFMQNELFYNNSAKRHGSAIYVDQYEEMGPSVLYITNCTVANNSSIEDGYEAVYVEGSQTLIENSIFWNNNNGNNFKLDVDGVSSATLEVNYTLTQQTTGFTGGTGNITLDPLFADITNGDFHVKSKAGRYNPANGQWVSDNVSSPAIDAGNPSSSFSNEPAPNGSRVNMGAYGNTAEASKSGDVKVEDNTQTLWNIFPNPATESITISNLPNGASVMITDLAGRKIYSSVIEQETTLISTVNLENGIYIIQVTDNGAISYRKFVVNR